MIPQKVTILCVDDDPVTQELLREILSSLGCEVFRAKSGEEALELITREKIDLIFLDIVMPGMDGFEVCKTIKQVERTRSIPVVMITSLISKEDRIKGIEAGAEEFLTKPFDRAEVLAWVKMFLKTKDLKGTRTGKILIDLGLIDERQLQEALEIAKKKNIKVGEALYFLGALTRDTLYWGLSNQLQMTYIELSTEMVDRELLQKFSLDVLKNLQCLPLYETNAEIHFAIADPTDQKIVEAVKSMRPAKGTQLYLGLPEKIADILSYYEREITLPLSSSEKPPLQKAAASIPPDDVTESQPVLSSGKLWDDLLAKLLSMPSDAVYWVYQTLRECRLLAQNGSTFKTAREYPAEVLALFQEKTKPIPSLRLGPSEIITTLSDGCQDRQAAFRIKPICAIDRRLFRIDRIPIFSEEEFGRAYSQAPRLKTETKGIFEENRRLVVGGPDRIFIKQFCYSLLMEYFHPDDFPPVFFIESDADMYLPKAAQLSAFEWDLGRFLKSIGEEVAPFVFYETDSHEEESIERFLWGFLSGRLNNVILGFPSTSTKAMHEVLSGYIERPNKGFRAVFIDASRVKSIC